MKKPEPINKHIVCSVCEQNWEAHGPKPTLEKCVELLKAELAKRPTINRPRHFYQSGTSPNVTQARGIPFGPDTNIGNAA